MLVKAQLILSVTWQKRQNSPLWLVQPLPDMCSNSQERSAYLIGALNGMTLPSELVQVPVRRYKYRDRETERERDVIRKWKILRKGRHVINQSFSWILLPQQKFFPCPKIMVLNICTWDWHPTKIQITCEFKEGSIFTYIKFHLHLAYSHTHFTSYPHLNLLRCFISALASFVLPTNLYRSVLLVCVDLFSL